MKILGGQYRSRQIKVPFGIRPVSLRVKKACFDILAGELPGTRVLDLFSGSGSLGLEALSRGAEQAVFVEAKASCADAIRKNIAALGLGSKSRVYQRKTLEIIEYFFKQGEKFDCLFMDPPYYKGMLRKALQALEEYDIVTPSGYVVAFGYIKDEIIEESRVLSLIDKRIYGQTIVLIYRRQAIVEPY
ncbi:MAG: 16S rRNA (guanine(966)-N(2))-methyltransferase RsmD [Candidatus Omnitrophota bacterium]